MAYPHGYRRRSQSYVVIHPLGQDPPGPAGPGRRTVLDMPWRARIIVVAHPRCAGEVLTASANRGKRHIYGVGRSRPRQATRHAATGWLARRSQTTARGLGKRVGSTAPPRATRVRCGYHPRRPAASNGNRRGLLRRWSAACCLSGRNQRFGVGSLACVTICVTTPPLTAGRFGMI